MSSLLKNNIKKTSVLLYGSLFLLLHTVKSQTYAPQVGIPGSTAIHKDSSVFVGWAVSCIVHRGYLKLEDTSFSINGTNKVFFGKDSLATGKPKGTMDVVSLGDGGYAEVSFEVPICDGEGYDFAIFENGFLNINDPEKAFLEFAIVEVSDDGKNFYAFPPVCEVPDSIHIGTFDAINARYYHNLAGKYIANYGTPFDLNELKYLYPQLNLNNIVRIRIRDVVGTENLLLATFDRFGNIIKDPYPTPFNSGGFDLDAVGVIHNVFSDAQKIKIFPNPVYNTLFITLPDDENFYLQIISFDGKNIFSGFYSGKFVKINLPFKYKGLAIVNITSQSFNFSEKILFVSE